MLINMPKQEIPNNSFDIHSRAAVLMFCCNSRIVFSKSVLSPKPGKRTTKPHF